MCGITGYSKLPDGISSVNKLSDSVMALHHRGPDDSGFIEYDQFGVGLGHTRLSIVDLSSQGHQPMISEDGSVSLVFNGEIYNHKELRRELELAGEIFVGNSDTEVLLRLYLNLKFILII